MDDYGTFREHIVPHGKPCNTKLLLFLGIFHIRFLFWILYSGQNAYRNRVIYSFSRLVKLRINGQTYYVFNKVNKPFTEYTPISVL